MSTATAEPKPYRFSVEQFNGLAESGVLPMDTSVELIDGQIFEMQPLGSNHCSLSQQIADALNRNVAKTHLVRVEKPIILDGFTEPVPEIAVARKRPDDPFFAKSHPKASEIELVVEVSDSSYLKDRNVKLKSYAQASVPELWIVNLSTRAIEWFRDPDSSAGAFGSDGVFDSDSKVTNDHFSLDLSELVF